MEKSCFTCIHVGYRDGYENFCMHCKEQAGEAPSGWQPVKWWKPDTRADRIRDMSDEELAQFLNPMGCPSANCRNCYEMSCTQCWLDWLQQPAEVHK